MNNYKLFVVLICLPFMHHGVYSASTSDSDNKSDNSSKSNVNNSLNTNSSEYVNSTEININSNDNGNNSDSQGQTKTESTNSSKETAKEKTTISSNVKTHKGIQTVTTKTRPSTNLKTNPTVQSTTVTRQTSEIKPTGSTSTKSDLQPSPRVTRKSGSTKQTTANIRKEDSSINVASTRVPSTTGPKESTNTKKETSAVEQQSNTNKKVKKVAKRRKPVPQQSSTRAKQNPPTTEEVVMTTAASTTEATATDAMETATTWDGLPCSSRFRAHPVDKTKFETAFAENVFEKIYHSCPSPLVWRQDQCRCGWDEPEQVESCNCCGQGLKAHDNDRAKYLRLVNGEWMEETCNTFDTNQIWDNEKCNCIWDPNKPQTHKAPVFKAAVLPKVLTKCMNLVNMTLDEGLKDSGGRDLTPMFGRQRIRVVDEQGNIGKSVEIRRAPFKIGIFNGNDLQSTVYFKFNFKVHPDQIRRRKKMVIMSNGCKRRWQRKSLEPSLEVAFFPYNETFEVQFSTTGKTILEYIKGTKDANGWYQCVLYLQDRILNLAVNGQKVYSTNGMSGRVKSTDCPLTVAGSPENAKEHFDGYLDELHVVKQCKYEPDAAS